MKFVSANPFRILGTAANTTEREIQRRVSVYSAYARVGKVIVSDYDFSSLPKVERTEDAIRSAAASIAQPIHRLHQAFFWFLQGNNVDKTALAYLINGQTSKASEIWSTAVKEKRITKRNFTYALNLSTLIFMIAEINGTIYPKAYNTAIQLKGRVVNSHFDEFCRLVAGENVGVDRKEVLKHFVDDILSIHSSGALPSAGLIDAFDEYPKETAKYVSERIVEAPHERIRTNINAVREQRTDTPESANRIGFELHSACLEDLEVLREVLGEDHPRVQATTNDLANEILQCSIDYFNYHAQGYEIDPGSDASRLLELAESIGPTGPVRLRISENRPNIDSWKSDAPERELMRVAKVEIDAITSVIASIQDRPPMRVDAVEIVKSCQSQLRSLAIKTGKDSEIYLSFCDLVVSTALGISVTRVNIIIEQVQMFLSRGLGDLVPEEWNQLKPEIINAGELFALFRRMDMSSEMRSRCETNQTTLEQMARNFGVPLSQMRSMHWTRQAKHVRFASNDDGPLFVSVKSEAPSLFASIRDWTTANPKKSLLFVLFLALGSAGIYDVCSSNSNRGSVSPKNAGRTVNSSNTNINASRSPSESPSPTPKIERPKTGAAISPATGGRGLGTLDISNGTANDAIAKLVNLSSGKTHREVFVRAGASTSIRSIAPGRYELYFSMGLDYAPSVKKFLRDASYSKFDEIFDFSQTKDSSGVNYRIYEVTLNKVAFGNARTSSVDESTFSSK